MTLAPSTKFFAVALLCTAAASAQQVTPSAAPQPAKSDKVASVKAPAKLPVASGKAAPPATAPDKDASLKKLDLSSASFTSAVATFKKDLFTKVVNDHEMQDGTTYILRTKGKVDEVGIKITGSGARTIVYSGKTGEAKDLQPTGCYNTYSAAKSKGTIDSLLALSFGASGKELDANWTITDKGSEALATDAKVTVEKFELIPKDQGLKDNIKMIELSTDLSTAISYKQVVHAPDGDTTTLTLSSVQRNKLPEKGQFEIKGKPCSK